MLYIWYLYLLSNFVNCSTEIKSTTLDCGDHSGYGLSQWETTLHYNVVSHWLSPYPEWSLRCWKVTSDIAGKLAWRPKWALNLGPLIRWFPRTLNTDHYNTHSTQKSPVRQQNAWFDTKKLGSTQKCPVRHKNALPSMHQWTLPSSNIPPPFCGKYFFPILFQYLLLRTNREMKIKLYWYEFITSIFNIIMKIEM